MINSARHADLLGDAINAAGETRFLSDGDCAMLFDPAARWTVDPQALASRSRNTPFAGRDLPPGTSDEQSIRRCEEILADHLDGHRLIPNGSRWIRFTTVRNRTWRHENVVLLGDAAHTAHFSIGSGTKLAMEDALALAACVPILYVWQFDHQQSEK